MLEVKYHLRVASTQEHNLPIDVVASPTSSSSISADISRFESVRSLNSKKPFLFFYVTIVFVFICLFIFITCPLIPIVEALILSPKKTKQSTEIIVEKVSNSCRFSFAVTRHKLFLICIILDLNHCTVSGSLLNYLFLAVLGNLIYIYIVFVDLWKSNFALLGLLAWGN